MREKPGPKSGVEGLCRPRTVSIDDRSMDLLKVAGSGNVSRGIRIGARLAYEHFMREQERNSPREAG